MAMKMHIKLASYKKQWWIIGVLGILFLLSFIFRGAGNFLVIDEKPIKSDVIIVLSGGRIDRLEKGVELYKKGFAPYLMISNGNEESLFKAAMNMGVPSRSIILENHARSTTDNALFTIKLMEKHNLNSAIVVSSDYHMRRVKTNYHKANKGVGFNFIYCSSQNASFNPAYWWKGKGNLFNTLSEYMKILGNYFGIHGDKAKGVLWYLF
jgi:uncharacterized SAM-binding protein YcdF (DUF218 family)